MRISLPYIAALVVAAAGTARAAPNCPPLGPVFEPPLNFKDSVAIRAVIANITETLRARDVDNSPGVRANETSYSIEVFSISDKEPVVFSWHHTAPALATTNTSGVRKVDADSVYRLGSLTKVHTVYTWLAQDGDAKFNEPITKYVPELAAAAKRGKEDPVAHVQWDEVTIGALASQMSGIIRDCMLFPVFSLSGNEKEGLLMLIFIRRWCARRDDAAVQPELPDCLGLPAPEQV